MECCQPRAMGRAALITVALAVAGCGGGYEPEDFPQISVFIEGQNLKTWEFLPDTTRGQIKKQAKVRIRNSGNADLAISAVDWQTTNPFLEAKLTSGQKLGKTPYATTLVVGASLELIVTYAPDPNIDNQDSAIISIKHNDLKTANPVVLTFTIQKLGARISLDQTEYTYINPSKSKPPEPCFRFGNSGSAPLTFNNAYIGTSNPYYTVTTKPNAGTTIAALGDTGNPKSNPAKLEVCVRLSPEDPQGDYDTHLVIETNDKTNPKAKVLLSAKWETGNTYKVSCTNASAQMLFDLSGDCSGSKTAICEIYNEGPSPMVITQNGASVRAYDSAAQSAVEQLYKLDLKKKSDDTVVSLPFSVLVQKSLVIALTITYPIDCKIPAAEVEVRYKHGPDIGSVRIPIVAGSAVVPVLSWAPSLDLWLQAGVGASASGVAVLANQSHVPLQIVKACASTNTMVGQDPCGAGFASTYFSLGKDVGLKTLNPWELLTIPVKFSPPNSMKSTVAHFLNVVYCAGKWEASSSQCLDGATATAVINLKGSLLTDVKLPSLDLAVSPDPQVNKLVRVDAIAKEGSYPLSQQGGYLWMVRDRPAGSTIWWSAEAQITDEPWISFVPDKEGTYVIVAAAQEVDETTLEYAWSTQEAVEMVVKAAATGP